jgi:hypothetical protein
MKKHLLPLILILSIIVFIVINKNRNYDSLIIALIAAFIAGELSPRIRKFYRQKKSLKKGIKAIKEGKSSIIEELEIMLSPNVQEDSLTISNTPKWIYKVKTDNTDEQLDILVSDFEILRKKSYWNEFIKNKTVIFNLYSDESFDEEIIKSIETKYD